MIFVKQLKQLIDETLDIPYIIVPVGSNCLSVGRDSI